MSELLPQPERLRWIVEHTARIIDAGAEPVSGLVLPTSKFFPDRFDRSEEAVARLLRRVLKLAGLSDLDVSLQLVSADGGGGCASGACGSGGPVQLRRVEERGDGAFSVQIAVNELGNPVILTTAMVRAVSHMFMKEAELYPSFQRADAEHGIDLVGVMLGFGSLLANGAYVYRKG